MFTQRNLRWRRVPWLVPLIVLAVMLMVAGTAEPGAVAEAAPQTISLKSGIGAVGSDDPLTQVMIEGGTIWQQATIVPGNVAWASPISGTNWIFCNSNPGNVCGVGASTSGKTTLYRAAFTLPAGYSAPSLSIALHADNAAIIRVNDIQIGQLRCFGISEASCSALFPGAGSFPNFGGDPETFSTSNSALFHAGTNYLQVDVWDVGGISGLDYSATVTYTPNSPPTLSVGALSVTVNEGATANNSGTFSDVDSANVSISASRGTVTKSGAASGTWSWSNAAPDGHDSYTVTITADDGNGGTATTTFNVTVNNVAPDLQISGANTAYYVNWTSANVPGGTASGVITLPDASTINVSLSTSGGGFFGAQTSGGTNYWVPSTPYISAQVPNAPPDSDIIQLQGGTNTVYTVTFSQPIVDPIMAILSLGSNSIITTYDFDSPFTIVSQGEGFWGGCSTCLRIKPGDVLEGQEGHGTIKFLGTYSSFSWTVPTPEIWHGFTFAVRSSQALAQTVIVNEGQTGTNNGTWSDVPADTVTLTASVGSVVKNSNGTWNWSFNTADGPSQSQTVAITATDKDGASTTKTFPLVVNNVAPTVNLQRFNPTTDTSPEGGPITVTSTVTDPSPVDSVSPMTRSWSITKNGSPYGAIIDIGDGHVTFIPDDNGTYVVTHSATDKDGGTGTASLQYNVTNVAPFGIIPKLTPSIINEGQSTTLGVVFKDPGSADTQTVVIDWADGSTDTLSLGAGVLTFSASHTYVDDDPTGTSSDDYTITITITDDESDSGTASTTVTVNNVAPSVDAEPEGAVNYSGQVHEITATYSDPGVADTHTATVDWGEGAGAQALGAVSGGSFGTSHRYFVPGTYHIVVCVTDDDRGTGCDTVLKTVKRLPVAIDIKPYSFPNSINLKGNGKIPVGVFSGTYHGVAFDTSSIIRSTVGWAGAPALPIGQSPQDLDFDGDLDQVFHFSNNQVNLTGTSTQACLTGQTSTGIYFEGCDSVRMVK